MKAVLSKINEIESSLNDLKTFVVDTIEKEEEKTILHFFPMNEFDKTIKEDAFLNFSFRLYNEDEIKQNFATSFIINNNNCTSSTKKELFAKKFINNTDTLLISDTFTNLVKMEEKLKRKRNVKRS